VRHHAEDIFCFIAYAGDVVHRAVGVELLGDNAILAAVTEKDLVILPDACDLLRRSIITAFTMGDRYLQGPRLVKIGGQRCLVVVGEDINILADELLVGVGQQRPRQQPCLTEDLKAVADAQDIPPTPGKTDHLVHDRGITGNGSRTQIIPV